MTDPRLSVITKRLNKVSEIIAVSGGKGGVGKSLIASTLALLLTKKGYSVGLFDLDFTSPSTHLILNASGMFPQEEAGILPPVINNMKYMSIIHYSGEHTLPLRGEAISNALIELFAITRWGSLDYLILDMPPGITDVTLDLIRFIKTVRFLIVTTPSTLAFETVKKLTSLLLHVQIPILGVIENMQLNQSASLKGRIVDTALPYSGTISYDPTLEGALGNINKLLDTTFAKQLKKIVATVFPAKLFT